MVSKQLLLNVFVVILSLLSMRLRSLGLGISHCLPLSLPHLQDVLLLLGPHLVLELGLLVSHQILVQSAEYEVVLDSILEFGNWVRRLLILLFLAAS